MPFKYQRTYEKNNAKRSKQEKKAVIDISDSSSEMTIQFIKDDTFQYIDIKSPDIIGSDWNDTFDKLKQQGPLPVTQPEIVINSDSINAPCNNSSFDGEMTDLASKASEKEMKEQNNVFKLMTDSESEVGSLNVTTDKTHHVKYDAVFHQKLKIHSSHTANNSDFDQNSLCCILKKSFNSESPKPNAYNKKPIAESTPKNHIIEIKNHNIQPTMLFKTPSKNVFNNSTNQYKKIGDVDKNIEKYTSNSKKEMKINSISTALGEKNISKAKNLIERRRRKQSNIEKNLKIDCSQNNKNESKIYEGNTVDSDIILSNLKAKNKCCSDDINGEYFHEGTKDRDDKTYINLNKNRITFRKTFLNKKNVNISSEIKLICNEIHKNTSPVPTVNRRFHWTNEYADTNFQDISMTCNIGVLNSSEVNNQNKSQIYLKPKNRFINTEGIKECDERFKYTVKQNKDNIEQTCNFINILPGKKWRRSLNIYIQNNSISRGAHINKKFSPVREDEQHELNDMTNVEKSDIKSEDINDNISKLSIVDKQLSYISISSDDLGYSVESNTSQKSISQSRSLFSNIGFGLNELKVYDPSPATSCEVVLRRCGQTEPVPFSHCYPDSALQKCHKIGEGLFGEVFLYKDLHTRECSVIKIIPIEGSSIVNGEKQKKFDEILSEIIIVMELSDLRTNNDNTTSGFSQLKKINCVKGKYPETLLHLWELYEEQFGSENDNPQMFGDDQLYVVLELGNGGRDLEAFQFTNAKQSLSIFQQVALTLAVAETALEFEHRDLHWGNVLIVSTSDKITSFKIDGRTVSIPLHGVKATIIDFTFSRITINGQALFSDLGADEELFSADGDYQFDIYRHMRKKNQNNWRSFQPYSNILWLHYLADKMISGARYTHTKSKIHSSGILELQFIKDSLLSYDNVSGFLEDFDYFS